MTVPVDPGWAQIYTLDEDNDHQMMKDQRVTRVSSTAGLRFGVSRRNLHTGSGDLVRAVGRRWRFKWADQIDPALRACTSSGGRRGGGLFGLERVATELFQCWDQVFQRK